MPENVSTTHGDFALAVKEAVKELKRFSISAARLAENMHDWLERLEEGGDEAQDG